MNITAEIKEVIRQNLPAAVGEELRAALTRLDELENKVVPQQALQISNLNAKLAKDMGVEFREQKAAERERTVDAREIAVTKREIEIKIIEVKLECAAQRVADLKEVTLSVFANARFKYSESGCTTVGATDRNGYVQSVGGPISREITVQ